MSWRFECFGTCKMEVHLERGSLIWLSFFWPTDRGTVQKVIVLPRDDLQTEELVLEEVEVFKVRSLALLLYTNLLISHGSLEYLILIGLFNSSRLNLFNKNTVKPAILLNIIAIYKSCFLF